MLEAKGQLPRGEFTTWVKRNFGLGKSQSALYMSYANTTSNTQKSGAPDFTSMRDFEREGLGVERSETRKADANTLILREADLNRAAERKAQRQLALQLIDLGFKALATKLHPDKGGSPDAMVRLNEVRDRLKQYV
jgi:hypothetical protein